MAQDPYKYFRLEARDLLDQFAKSALDLERSGDAAPHVQQLLRLAHTLKGAARVVKQQEIANRAHAIEDTLSPLRKEGALVTRAQIDLILEQIDGMSAKLSELAPAETATDAAPAKATAEEGLRTIRTDIIELDTLLDGVSETHASLNRLRSVARDMEQSRHLADTLAAQLTPRSAADPRRQQIGSAGRLLSTVEELRRRFGISERNLDQAIDQMDRELRQLHDTAEQLRLVPVDSLFTSLERMARDTASALSKRVVFQSHGGDIRLDSSVIETVRDALLQIVRNAVAHGLEPETERRANGKDETGRVTVNIARRGRQIVFECRDDGRGLDVEEIRRVAEQRGLLNASAVPIDAAALIRLLLRGGISTSNTVTEVSGRGVGLDVVREALTRLGGEIVVDTESGKGTTFQLIVPRSLTSVEALVVEVSETATVIPLDAVRTSMRVMARDIACGSTGASVFFGKTAIPFFALSSTTKSKAIDRRRLTARRDCTAVVVAGSQGLVAIGVDRVLETARVVVHPLPDHTPASAIVSGASLDAEGNPQLVLDPEGLVALAYGRNALEMDSPATKRPLLVVDDSLTTRMLEQSILESAGYDVDVALSGEEGLERVRRKAYALILVDVEMPGMSGFAFIEQIRADPTLRHIPAILVTSLDAPEYRQRGRDAGAQGYIVKSEFDQADLLTLITSLMS